MFSLFKKRPGIHIVKMPDFGWTKQKMNDTTLVWNSPDGTCAISAEFYNAPPDIPSAHDVKTVRKFFREMVSGANGGIIEINTVAVQNIPSVKNIFKFPQESSGVTYLASIIVPFDNCSFVLKVQCLETAPTGMRDSVIGARLLNSGELQMGENGPVNWSKDPYDNDFKEGLLMNLSEHEKYDLEFPEHPLTKTRNMINIIQNETSFDPEISKLKFFSK